MHLFRYNDTFTRNCQLNSTEAADNLRVGLVGVVGTGLALTSLVENLILFYVFSTSRKLRRQNYANPVLLSCFDSIVSFCYILTSSMNVIAYRLASPSLVRTWASYMRFAYCLQASGHFSLTTANYLLVVASLERYLANGPMLKQTFQKRLLVLIVGNKPMVLALIVFLSFLFKATLYFETDTMIIPFCNDLENVIPIWLTNASDKTAAFRFWTRKVCTIILPFLLLAFCNAHIVLHLRRKRKQHEKAAPAQQPPTLQQQGRQLIQQRSTSSQQAGGRRQSIKRRYSEKKGVRIATRTLVMVVGCYLISNVCSFGMNVWEYFDMHLLRYEHYYSYLLASDVSVLLTIAGCALRLPIYVVNDGRIRKAIFRALIRFRYCGHAHNLRNVPNGNLEKWSIVVVSNSLRSNLTGIFSNDMRGKKSFDQLAVLVQNRRRFLVQMTINLGAVHELGRAGSSDDNHWDSTELTDSDEHVEMLCNSSRTLIVNSRPIEADGQQNRRYAAIATPSASKSLWRHR
ncbi:G-PROTEIN-RECEP-F1-2 domain-containing protein [Aphelenchoides fujianensis]|nr:G-PROTEIN-RECEP-F1-2 domain-containing protein [Aphelenchoides fujianensis]